MINIDKIIESKKHIIIGIVLLVAIYIAYDVFGSGNIGSRGSEISNNIQSTRDQQQSAIVGVGNAENIINDQSAEVGRISEGVGGVATSIKTLEPGIEESINRSKSSADLIREGQSIIQRVQQRNSSRN